MLWLTMADIIEWKWLHTEHLALSTRCLITSSFCPSADSLCLPGCAQSPWQRSTSASRSIYWGSGRPTNFLVWKWNREVQSDPAVRLHSLLLGPRFLPEEPEPTQEAMSCREACTSRILPTDKGIKIAVGGPHLCALPCGNTWLIFPIAYDIKKNWAPDVEVSCFFFFCPHPRSVFLTGQRSVTPHMTTRYTQI